MKDKYHLILGVPCTAEEISEFKERAKKSGMDSTEYARSLLFPKKKEKEFPSSYAFIDGSYNKHTKTYGYGGFLVHDGKREVLQGTGDDEEMGKMQSVAGEILGSETAIKKAIELGLPEITLYYDYLGIEFWATGEWERHKKYTIKYHDFIKGVENTIKIHFVKVKSHSGIPGNEEADRLAKEAVGLL